LSTKIHTLADALGNPVDVFLTGCQVHDLVGADHLLPTMETDLLLADKAFDADERVIAPLAAAGKAVVIPPKANRRLPRDFDRHLYSARHLIENFFANSSSSAPLPLAMTRRHATSSPPSISLPAQFGSIDDTP
jgi:transposase